MKKNYLLIGALFCCLALSACSNSSGSISAASTAETSTGSAATQTTDETTTEAAAQESTTQETAETQATLDIAYDLQDLQALLGKSDQEVTETLGEGTADYTEDNLILTREYNMKILDTDADVTLSFNLYRTGDNQLELCRILLPNKDLKLYAEQLEAIYGAPSETYEKSYYFTTEQTTLVLANPFDDEPYIEISLNETE